MSTYECPECGKHLATAGGLELHMEMAHAPEPEPEPVELAELAVSVEPVAPARPSARPRRGPRPGPVADVDDQQRPDPTVPLAWALVILLFIGSVTAAMVDPSGLGVLAAIAG